MRSSCSPWSRTASRSPSPCGWSSPCPIPTARGAVVVPDRAHDAQQFWLRRPPLPPACPSRTRACSAAPRGSTRAWLFAASCPAAPAHRAQPTYIHYEFELPFFAAPVKVDVVSRPSAAKIFFESDIHTAMFTFDETGQVRDRPWATAIVIPDVAQAWLTVSVPYTFFLTENAAYKFFDSGFEVKVWDSRDKVSPRARFDRPPVPPLKKTLIGGASSHASRSPLTAAASGDLVLPMGTRTSGGHGRHSASGPGHRRSQTSEVAPPCPCRP